MQLDQELYLLVFTLNLGVIAFEMEENYVVSFQMNKYMIMKILAWLEKVSANNLFHIYMRPLIRCEYLTQIFVFVRPFTCISVYGQ